METTVDMRVTKRDGQLEDIAFDKILRRIKNLGQEVNIHINYASLVMKVIDQLYDKISTAKIDELAAEQCASMSTLHYDYGTLAARIVVSNHQKNTEASFFNVMKQLYEFKDVHGVNRPLVSHSLMEFTTKYQNEIEETLDYKRDYLIDYFGFKTLERAYLFRLNNKVVERPQHMWMRVSIGIHGDVRNPRSLELVKETYHLMSQKYFTHATPTLFNAGTPRPQMSSCYLIAMEDDSLDGIYNTLKDCALISKYAGGIGLHIHNVRAKGTHIQGTNGQSNGIVPMLRVFNNTARYVDQCVHPETIIYTTQGPMQIQNCSFGETCIYNAKGQVEVIENVLEHPYEGEILNIETMHVFDNLRITPEHPIFVLRNQKKGLNYELIKNRLDKNICSFEWIDAKDLTTDDMLVYRVPEYSKDMENINEDDCYMYGILLGDGCMNNDDQTGYISLHAENKKHILEFCVEYFEKKCIQYTITNVQENCTRIRWNKTINMPFRYSDVYDTNKEKHMHHKWLNLPIHKSKYILKGLIDTDGCIHKEIVFDSTSRNLIETARFIALKMGMLTSGYIRDRVGESHETERGTITNKKISYCLRLPKSKELCELINVPYDENNFFKFIKYNNYLLSRVKNISKENYSGTLYDLQMKEEHNYMLHNGIVHNGGGKRNGSFAIYLEPWHADIFDFLELRKNHGDEELKARDLFYALWMPDLFMERVKEKNGKWSLFCPHECPGLSDVYGDDFKTLYEKYEREGKARKTIDARDLWFAILDAQMETGTPYITYKDHINRKSNQKNLGTIKSSNLCVEINQYSDDIETAVCNLASIALPSFVKEDKTFDYDKLHEVTKVVTNNLNRVIDINFYPTEKTRRSNFLHRPIGLGVQGLADTFILMDVPFHSEDARKINKLIFETIYHAALEKSNELAIEIKEQIKSKKTDLVPLVYYMNEYSGPNAHGLKPEHYGAYQSFEGSPASQGILQFDMWNVQPTPGRYDWDTLKQSIMDHGIRNSLLVAPMPTASTSQILGFNECFEPLTSNLYSRRTLAGEFVVVNKYLMKDLMDLGHWNEQTKNNIIANKGSIQQLTMLPEHIRNKYKIVWEMPMKHLIDMSAERGAFICQSQSLNLWMEDPVYNKLTSMHFYAWEKGLKTGIYYLRRKAKHQAQQFTIEPEKKEHVVDEKEEICEMCSA